MADDPFLPGFGGSAATTAGVSPIVPIQPNVTPVVGSGRGKTSAIDVGGYWINHFKLEKCKDKPNDYCDNLVAGFVGTMGARGHKVTVLKAEQAASPRHWGAWTDKQAGGIDTVEFAFLATHGSTHGFERSGSDWLFWWIGTFDSPDGCLTATIAFHGGVPDTPRTPVVLMRLGEGRLRWVVLDTCRSLQVALENERDQDARYELQESNPERTWGRCFDGISMIFGFTGLVSDASWTRDRGRSFGHRVGRGEALADSWLDEAYSHRLDDVPVALACGQSKDDAEKRLKGESLKRISQRLSSKNIGWYAWMWRS